MKTLRLLWLNRKKLTTKQLKSLKKKITALEKEVVELSTSKSSLKAKLEQTETDLKNS